MLRRASRPCARARGVRRVRVDSFGESRTFAKLDGGVGTHGAPDGVHKVGTVCHRPGNSAQFRRVTRCEAHAARRRTPAASRAAGVCRAGRSGAPPPSSPTAPVPRLPFRISSALWRVGDRGKDIPPSYDDAVFPQDRATGKESSCGAAAPLSESRCDRAHQAATFPREIAAPPTQGCAP